MSGRLFEPDDGPCVPSPERLLVVSATVLVFDRGEVGPDRFEAQLAAYPPARGSGGTPWQAVRGLVVGHRPLLERRWSSGAAWT